MHMKVTVLTVCVILSASLLVSCDNEKGQPSPELMGGYLDLTEDAEASAEASAESSAETDGETFFESAAAGTDEVLTDDDILLITHLVACEMGTRPYMTQVCFAAMVLNRIGDAGFPQGPRGVVFDSGDFKSVMSGEVNGTIPASFTASSKYRIASKAVNEALGGNDPTGGALYFATSDDITSGIAPAHECGGVFFGR